MKKIFTLVVFTLVLLPAFCQIPKNNLGKTVQQLSSKFPNLEYSTTRDAFTEYESDGITFTFKNGKVVCESMMIDEGRAFGKDWFNAMYQSFKKTSYQRVTKPSDNDMCVTTVFYYSDFWITLAYWHDDGLATITYQNPDYFK